MSQSAIDQLARLRTIGGRESAKVLKLGKQVLGDGNENGNTNKRSGIRLGSEEWSIREQVAIAALDMGDIDYAKSQITFLTTQFPSSPRLILLRALELESTGDYPRARKIYTSLLGKGKGKEEKDDVVRSILRGSSVEGDECFVPAHQRLITMALYGVGEGGDYQASVTGISDTESIAKATTKPTKQHEQAQPIPTIANILKALPFIHDYLSTFHTDPDAWSLLADLYIILSGFGGGIDNVYARGTLGEKVLERVGKPEAVLEGEGKYLDQALSCLAQRMLLEPWNWKEVTRYGEIALLAGDISLAYKMFLRSIEMSTDPAAVNDPSGSDDDEGAAAPASTTVEGEGRSTDLGKIMNTGGWKTRTWWDLKLTTSALQKSKSAPSSSSTSAPSSSLSPTDPSQVDKIETLSTMRLRALVGEQVIKRWEEMVVMH